MLPQTFEMIIIFKKVRIYEFFIMKFGRFDSIILPGIVIFWDIMNF
jgi:hypothetical protein